MATTITTRAGKGSALTHTEMDANLAALRDTADAAATGADLTAHAASASNPHGVTKSQVGLNNVDNTADAEKPVSTAQALAIESAVSAHEAAADPHPGYLTLAEANAAYAPINSTGVTNLSVTASPTGATVASDTGTDAVLPAADATNAGLMLPAQVAKLADAATGAQGTKADAALPATADAIADVLEAAPIADPAAFARIQASVSGGSTGYDLIIVAGQSNSIGTDTTFDQTYLDPIDPRIWRYVNPLSTISALVPYVSTISLAFDPLGHIGSLAGMGPGLPCARQYADGSLGSRRRVLLVPCGYNGSALVDASGQSWNPTLGGALADQCINTANAAVLAAGPNTRIAGFVWMQGETDAISNRTGEQYQAALVALVAKLRAGIFGASSAPFVVLGMVPEFQQGTHAQIRAVHVAMPSLVASCAFANHVGGVTGDSLHYTAPGQRILGKRAYWAMVRAANSPGVLPDAPSGLAVVLVAGSTVGLSWAVSAADTVPIVDHLIEYSVDAGATWTSWSHQPIFLGSAKVTGLAGGTPHLFRVSAIDAAGIVSQASASVGATTSEIYSLFDHSTAPTGVDQNGTFVLGTAIATSAGGYVPAIWTYASAAMVVGTALVALYGSEVATTPAATATAVLALGWNRIEFADRVAVEANSTIVAAVIPGSKFFAQINSASWPMTSGVLTAAAEKNARYSVSGAMVNPSSLIATYKYPVDIEFSAS